MKYIVYLKFVLIGVFSLKDCSFLDFLKNSLKKEITKWFSG
jgi:hypothetical protein